MATLPPPPLSSPMAQGDGTPSPAWSRWLSLLQSLLTAAPSWQTPSFLNGWGNRGSTYMTARFLVDIAGIVHLEGAISGGTINAAAFTLPAGMRPSADIYFRTVTYDGATNGEAIVRVSADGTVTPIVGSNVEFHLSGVTFPAEG